MSAKSLDRPAPRGSTKSAGIALAAGVGFGGLVSLSAFLLARYGPAGGDWSFRGNGALAAYSLIPALLAGGWTAVVLHHRGQAWIALGSAAAGVGIGLADVDAVLLPVFGSSVDQAVGPIVLLALVAWCVVAPVVAMRFPRGQPQVKTSIGVSISAAVLWAIGLSSGLVVVGFALPAGS